MLLGLPFAICIGTPACFAQENARTEVEFQMPLINEMVHLVSDQTSVAGFKLASDGFAIQDVMNASGFQVVNQNATEPQLRYTRLWNGQQLTVDVKSFVNTLTLFRGTEDFDKDNIELYTFPAQVGNYYAVRRYAVSNSSSYGVNATWAEFEKKLGVPLDIKIDHNGIQSASVVFSVYGTVSPPGECVDEFSNGMGERGVELGLAGYSVGYDQVAFIKTFVREDCATFFSVQLVPDARGNVFKLTVRSVDGLALLNSMVANNKIVNDALDALEAKAAARAEDATKSAPDL